jgi:iron(III) transport system substrate-binding protein
MQIRLPFRAAIAALFISTLAGNAWAADAALIAAAKKSPKLTWYTTLIVNQFARPVAEAFQKKYGIRVEYARADNTETNLRIANEVKAGRIMVDIFDGFGAPALERAGALVPFVPEGAKAFGPEFYDANGLWVATNLYILTPGFNTQMIPKGTEPRTFEDLLDPKYKGKITWNTSLTPSGAPGFVGVVLAEMGEQKGMDYLRRLSAQQIVGQRMAARAVLDRVIAGEYALALNIFNHHAVISAKKGAPSDWIPMQPALGVLSVFSIVKNGPSTDAAKLFLDFLTSTEGQAFFRDADYIPADPKVTPIEPSLRPDGKTLRIKFFTPAQVDENLGKWADIAKEIFR